MDRMTIGRSVRACGVLGLALALAGCDGGGGDADGCSPACRAGFTCRGGACVEGCSPACRAGYACNAGRCVREVEARIGEPCGAHEDCGAGGFCNTTAPGGRCARPCGGGINPVEARCPEGSVCTQWGPGGSECLVTCHDDADCRDGYTCGTSDFGDRVCVVACRTHADCPRGRGCDPASGRCLAERAPSGLVGQACAADAQCEGGLCLRDAALPGGYCSADCADAECPPGSTCVTIGSADPNAPPLVICQQSCQVSAECRPEYYCGAVSGVADRAPVCIPKCRTDDICAADQRCDRSTGVCVPRQPAAETEVDVVDLGTVRFGGNRLGPVEIEVPPDALSFHLVARTRDHQGLAAPWRVVGPAGDVLFDFAQQDRSLLRVHPSAGRAQLLYPNSPRLTLRTGRYQIAFATDGPPSDFEVHALIKRASGPVTRGRLDLNLVFAGVPGLTATTAPDDPAFQRVLAGFAQRYATVGVEIGGVRYVDLPPADARRFAVIESTDGPGNELEQVYASAEPLLDGRGLTFYFVRTIEGAQPGFVILGIAGGIPGPASTPERIARGVAVTAESYAENPDGVALTMVHEAGHYLGLFHLSERDGRTHDPLPDTPECRPDRDRDGDGVLLRPECGGAGTENIMFWQAGPGDLRFSNDQAFVLHRNPAIR